MPNIHKANFLEELENRTSKLRKLSKSLSLFELSNQKARIYIRYSKVHGGTRSFYGLRHEDLLQLEGFNSFVCFIWDNQETPLFIPYADFEEVFNQVSPSNDGQYKVQIFHQTDQTEMYIANAGRFNIESFFGWEYFEREIDKSKLTEMPELSHSQVQTLIGSIGILKGYDIWIPPNDRNRLDWNLSFKFNCINDLPLRFENINNIIKEVDVIWVHRGSSGLQAMFEVEHSTPIYSGLLRFNDFHLIDNGFNPRFSIVSNEIRRGLFLKQVNRPTFKTSGLSDVCNFLEYKDVYGWFHRINQ